MKQDEIENEIVYLMKRTAYLSIENNNLNGLSDKDIVLEIERLNPERVCPEFVVRRGRNLKIIFYSHEAREEAISSKLAINSMMCELTRPYQETRMWRKILYFHGIPITETAENFKAWVATRKGMKSCGEHRWVTWAPNSKVKTTSRSVEVEMQPGAEVPGYTWYHSVKFGKVPVRIWYIGVEDWCRFCEQKGHVEANCREVKEGEDDKRKQRQEAEEKKNSERAAEIRASQDPEKKELATMLNNEYGNKTTLFYGKKDIFSNFYPCEVEVDGTKYNCTEQYLVTEKIREVCKKDTELCEQYVEEVMKETRPAHIKRLGRIRAPWKESIESWHKFAEQRLEIGNEAKYGQNAPLREALFKTSGTRLVEAGYDFYWGCGWNKDSSEAADPEKWKGLNSFGDLLTHLRRRFMAHRSFSAEAHKIRLEVAEGRDDSKAKRMRHCSPSESPKNRMT